LAFLYEIGIWLGFVYASTLFLHQQSWCILELRSRSKPSGGLYFSFCRFYVWLERSSLHQQSWCNELRSSQRSKLSFTCFYIGFFYIISETFASMVGYIGHLWWPRYQLMR
jgi:hypothetical protein